jgi:hypothetical protein
VIAGRHQFYDVYLCLGELHFELDRTCRRRASNSSLYISNSSLQRPLPQWTQSPDGKGQTAHARQGASLDGGFTPKQDKVPNGYTHQCGNVPIVTLFLSRWDTVGLLLSLKGIDRVLLRTLNR